MIIGIDFDGTLVDHQFPKLGKAVPGAIETCHALIAAGHQLILWTMRSGETLSDAEGWCQVHGIALYGINRNPDQKWSTSPKAYCHVYIDDAALGCPLVRRGHMDGARDWVDWPTVREMLHNTGILPAIHPEAPNA
jgi:hypothetical protein